jgi:hypothetical protein
LVWRWGGIPTCCSVPVWFQYIILGICWWCNRFNCGLSPCWGSNVLHWGRIWEKYLIVPFWMTLECQLMRQRSTCRQHR